MRLTELTEDSNKGSHDQVNAMFGKLKAKQSSLTKPEQHWFTDAISQYQAAGEYHTKAGLDILANIEQKLSQL